MAEINVEATFNRTLGRRATKQIEYLQNVNGSAYTIRGRELIKTVYLVTDEKRDFKKYATRWEKLHSTLGFGNHASPVVDANLLVVGHFGTFSSEHIFVLLRNYSGNRNDVSNMVAKGVEVFADAYNKFSYTNRGFTQFDQPQQRFDVVTDVDGQVLAVLNKRDRDGIEPSWLSPLDLITIGKLIAAGISLAVAGFTIRTLARRAAAKAITSGSARELGSGADRELLERIIQGSPPQVGYGQFGEPGHLLASIEVAGNKVTYRVKSIFLTGAEDGTARAAHREMIKRAAQEAQKRGQKQFTFQGINAGAGFRAHADKLARAVGVRGSGRQFASTTRGWADYEVTLDAAKVLRSQ